MTLMLGMSTSEVSPLGVFPAWKTPILGLAARTVILYHVFYLIEIGGKLFRQFQFIYNTFFMISQSSFGGDWWGILICIWDLNNTSSTLLLLLII